MSANKETVEKYMEGFRRSDHAMVLSCLTDDIEWSMPGAFHITGKDAFDKEIESDCYVGSPAIDVSRLTEENDVVVAEGTVRSVRKEGGTLTCVFCDILTLRDGKICHITSYVVEQ